MPDPMNCSSQLRKAAQDHHVVDLEVYRAHQKDPFEPLLDLTARKSRMCILGRDLGATEVGEGRAFVGHAGQRIRSILDEFSIAAEHCTGSDANAKYRCLLLNAIPYKVLTCNAVRDRAIRLFHAPILRLLVHEWAGQDVITVGPEAFFWFSIDQEPEIKKRLAEFWNKGAVRYLCSIAVVINTGPDTKRFILHPVPHPSRRNARWYSSFPFLLRCRLENIFAPL